MKKILGLDLGTNSIGWALVDEAENEIEHSSIKKIGVRIIHYDNFVSTKTGKESKEPEKDFISGKGISPNAGRTLKRSMRRNLQRYKLRRNNLIQILKEAEFITDDILLSENGNHSTFQTYRLRAKAAVDKVTLEEFGRVLLMINKKRGYKSSRKAKSQDEGQIIDGMAIAKKLYNEGLTPGQFVLEHLKSGKKSVPDFYRSDLQVEYDKVWNFQHQFYPEILTEDFKKQIEGKGKVNSGKTFLGKYDIYTAENKGADKRLQTYQWRVDALNRQLNKEELAFVISDVNGQISASSGYLGAISDRSKELFFNKITVGQYLMAQLDKNPHTSLRNQVFYRQDYLDEFNILWEKQSQFHPELSIKLKDEIRDVIVFYQRKLKSQKGLISFCEFESQKIEIEIDGVKKTRLIGRRVCPRSSPLFQQFKIWQILNNVKVKFISDNIERLLFQEEKENLYQYLLVKNKLSKDEIVKILFKKSKDIDLNFKDIEGNRTVATFIEVCFKIIELSGHGEFDYAKMHPQEMMDVLHSVFETISIKTDILEFQIDCNQNSFESSPFFMLWHLLYSFEGDDSISGHEKLLNKLHEKYGFQKEYANILANISFTDDYSNLSTKAIRNILPFLQEGHSYDLACAYAGYRHSKSSLTKEEIENKILKERLEILPKNSLRNPVVEKILNQMINVINLISDTYGKPDEIRIELARELKKNAKERENLTKSILETTAEHEKIRSLLQSEFGFTHVSRNDIIRFKLYSELETVGYKTLYSNTYISREKLFSKEIDIEHIIPQSRIFDDSFSNKTLETREVNIEKGNDTACDYVLRKNDEDGLDQYLKRIEDLFKNKKISGAKYRKLKMKGQDIPDDFIERDLRDTQYIARKAKTLLEEYVKEVISTTGQITDRLREDWQLIDVMQELNWEKYEALGMTEFIENRDGHKIRRIKDWTKRNDHRHHAMDALTVAFTKRSYIQYLNNLNAKSDKSSSIYGIEVKELSRDNKGKLKFNPPMQIDDFRAEAKKHLENILVSIKAKNKVATSNINITTKKGSVHKKKQLTPRGQLHLETVYGSSEKIISKEEKVNASFTEERILQVANLKFRNALMKRLLENNYDPKIAFTGKNSLEKNPCWIDEAKTQKVPEKLKVLYKEIVYTIRKDITPDLKIDKVVDEGVKRILSERLNKNNGDAKKAFSNLDENPIWLNEEKGISVKRVTITGISNAVALHDKRDKDGKIILNSEGKPQPVDFVNTGNNHHVAIYRDEQGNLQEKVVSFFEATTRVNQGMPVIDKDYKKSEGWEFLFSMKQNEYFVFPNEKTTFNPHEIDLMNPENYHLISPNLFRVQKLGEKDYWFRHHLETQVIENPSLQEISFKRRRTTKSISTIIKVRINHIGQIVSVGEY